MENYKYFILLCVFNFLCFVSCDLNLTEGSACVTRGANGTCLNVYNCLSAGLTFIYNNAGFHSKFPEFPEVCSYQNGEPVVCCTDCYLGNVSLRNQIVAPLGGLVRKGDSIAKNKCYEYFDTLPYKCRGYGNIKLEKMWNETLKCFEPIFASSLAVGGRDAERWEFPHMALLGYGDDDASAQWLCGGSVISERFILTAAHCTSTKTLGNISFAALGLLRRSDPKEDWKVYKIKRIIIHPDYKAPSKYHDIALLETQNEIAFGQDLLPACLNTDPKFWSDADAAGWGRLGHRKALADTLQLVKLSPFDESTCAKIYKQHRHLQHGYDHEKQMCFGAHGRIIDTCEGDSGGPLQYDKEGIRCMFTIVGVTSYGKDCGIADTAGMYTRVSYYIPWIESIVWPEEVEEKRIKDNLLIDK